MCVRFDSYADLADLGVTAVLDAGATANSTAKANGIAVVAAGSGWDSVGCLNLTLSLIHIYCQRHRCAVGRCICDRC